MADSQLNFTGDGLGAKNQNKDFSNGSHVRQLLRDATAGSYMTALNSSLELPTTNAVLATSQVFDLDSTAGQRDLDLTQQELHRYKQRIDNQTESQRRQADLMNQLQNQVSNYRRRCHELESQLMQSKPKPLPASGPVAGLRDEPDGDSSYAITVQDPHHDFTVSRLEEDHLRSHLNDVNHILREQLDAAVLANQSMNIDLQRAAGQLEVSKTELRNKEEQWRTQEKLLYDYFAGENKRLLELWSALQRLKGCLSDLKSDTHRDLESLHTTLHRCAKTVVNSCHKLSMKQLVDRSAGGGSENQKVADILERLTIGVTVGSESERDKLISDALRQLQHARSDGEQAKASSGEIDDKLSEATSRVAELEDELASSRRDVEDLETRLKRSESATADCLEALRKLQDLSELESAVGESRRSTPSAEKRSRSLSPQRSDQFVADAVRRVRRALLIKQEEIERLKRQLSKEETRFGQCRDRTRTVEDEKRELERRLRASKSLIAETVRVREEAERQTKRAENRLTFANNEKEVLRKTTEKLEQQLKEIKTAHEEQRYVQPSLPGAVEASEGGDFADTGRSSSLEAEFRMRQQELLKTIEEEKSEVRRLQSDLTRTQDKLRAAENERDILQERQKHKDASCNALEEENKKLAEELSRIKNDLSDSAAKLSAAGVELEGLKKHAERRDKVLAELKSQREALLQEKRDVIKVNAEMRAAVDAKERTFQARESSEKELRAELCGLRDAQLASKGEVERFRDERAKLEAKLKLLEQAHEASVAEQNKVHSNSEQLNLTVAKLNEEKNELQRANDGFAERSKELTEQLNRSMDDRQANDNRLQQYSSELARLKRLLASTNEKLAGGEAKCADLREANEHMKVELDRHQERIRAENEEWRGAKAKMAGRIAQLEETSTASAKELTQRYEDEIDRMKNQKTAVEEQVALVNENLKLSQEEVMKLKSRFEEDLEQERAALDRANRTHEAELDDHRDRHRAEMEKAASREEELKEELSELQRNMENTKRRAEQIESQNFELERANAELKDELAALKDKMEQNRLETERDVEKWKAESVRCAAALSALETLRSAEQRKQQEFEVRYKQLSTDYSDAKGRVRDLSSQKQLADADVSAMKELSQLKDAEVADLRQRLVELEPKYGQARSDADRLFKELDAVNREVAALKMTKSALQSEMTLSKEKLAAVEAANVELNSQMDHARYEKDSLDSALSEKTAEYEQSYKAAEELRSQLSKLRLNYHEAKMKLSELDSVNKLLEQERDRLQEQLDASTDQLDKRHGETQSTLDELLQNYRQAEDGRLEALRARDLAQSQCEEVAIRRDALETQATELHDRLTRSISAKQELAGRFALWRAAARRAMALTGLAGSRAAGTSSGAGLPPKDTSMFLTADNVLEVQPDVDVADRTTDDSSGAGKDGSHSSFYGDVSIESVFKLLSDRIEKLEKEKTDVQVELQRQNRRLEEAQQQEKLLNSRYRSLESELSDAEEAKHVAEARLQSNQSLILAQEEAIRSRDECRRDLKGKLTGLEAVLKRKEAALAQLLEQHGKVKDQLEERSAELSAQRSAEDRWETVKFQLEARVRHLEVESQDYKGQLDKLTAERETVRERLLEAEDKWHVSESRTAGLETVVATLKTNLTKSEQEGEEEMRNQLESMNRSVLEQQALQDKLNAISRDLNAASSAKDQLERDLKQARTECRDWKERSDDLNDKVFELQRRLTGAVAERDKTAERLGELEGKYRSLSGVESDLRRQLQECETALRGYRDEGEELKRCIGRIESEKKYLNEQLARAVNDAKALKAEIVAMDDEKKKTELRVRDILKEKEALDRSLTTMERENLELSNNCHRLQTQIGQLTLSNGQSWMNRSKEIQTTYQKQVDKLLGDKAELNDKLSQTTKEYSRRLRQLEAKNVSLSHELEKQHRKLKDFVEKATEADKGISHLRAGMDESIQALRSDPRLESLYNTSAGSSELMYNPLRSRMFSSSMVASPQRPLANSTPHESPAKRGSSGKLRPTK